jgi:hypothetical protein
MKTSAFVAFQNDLAEEEDVYVGARLVQQMKCDDFDPIKIRSVKSLERWLCKSISGKN